MTFIEAFIVSYIETALCACVDDQDRPLENSFSIDDLHPDTRKQIEEDCRAFRKDAKQLLSGRNLLRNPKGDKTKSFTAKMAGHDFYLTRNGHGAGFWDGDWADPAGDLLTEKSKPYGTFVLYRGDDDLLHHHG